MLNLSDELSWEGQKFIRLMGKEVAKEDGHYQLPVTLRKRDHPTSTPRRIDVDSTWILRRYFEDQISMNFHVISAYFFDVISMVKKSTSVPRTFFDEISLVEKSTLFPRTFFDVVSMVEKSMLFPRTFFDVICLVEICTLFLLIFFDVILMGKNSTSFSVSCKLMKTFEKVFPVSVTLNSSLLQDCSL